MVLRPALLTVIVVALLAAPAKAALYDDLGAGPGIDRIVADATARFLADPRIAPTFDDTNMERFKRMLASQLCHVSGGPCVYTGRSMTAAHHGLQLGQAQFNALVEDLQDAMTKQGVGYHTQNELLALLAPMQRDVVTR